MDLFDRINQQQQQNQDVQFQVVTPELLKTVQGTSVPMFQVNLTPAEQAIVTERMSMSSDPDSEKERWQQAILMSRQYDVPLEYAIENLETIVKYQTDVKPQFNQTFTRSLMNSYEIGNLTVDRGTLSEQFYWARQNGEDTTEIERKIDEVDSKIAEMYDYTPRKWYQEILKGAAQTLGYTANVAAVSAGLGALGNLAAPGLGTALATVGGFAEGFRLTKYSSYYDMVKAGVDPTTANWTSTLSGGIQAAIESVIGIEAGLGRIAGGGSANFVTKLMKNMYLNGTFNTIGLVATKYVTNVVSEGIEEFLQEITDKVFTNIAYTQSGMDAPYSVSDTMKAAVESFVQGAGAALVLGVTGTIAETVNDVSYAKAMKQDALTTASKQVFIEKHMEDEQLEGIGAQRRREALSQTYDNINTQYEEAIEGLSTAEARTVDVDTIDQPENAGMEDEEGNIIEPETSKELPELKRMDNGRLRVQESANVVQMSDGSERHQLLVGSNDGTSNRYGTVTYTINEDGSIDINNVKTRSGYQGITQDAIQELARRYPGVELRWDPEIETQQQIRQSMLDNSPTGQLNWYESSTDAQERTVLAEKIGKAFTNLNKDERNVAAVLMQLRAQAKGMTASEYMDNYISGMEEGDLDKGKLGRTVIKGAKAVITAGKSANFSTFAHETFHVIRNEMTEEENRRLAEAFKEAVDTKSFKQFVAASRKVLQMDYNTIRSQIEAMDGMSWNEAQEEIAARMFESYLLNGKTSNSKLADLFSKIAEFFRKIYGVLRGQKMLNDNIIEAYDSLFEQSSEANQTVAQETDEKVLEQTSPEAYEDIRTREANGKLYISGNIERARDILSNYSSKINGHMEGKELVIPASKVRLAKEALYGANTAFGNTSARWTYDKNGNILGAPDLYNTADKVNRNLMPLLIDLVDEGMVAKDWYENSGRAMLRAVGGDIVEAEKLAGIVALLSPQNTVKVNLYQALDVWAQYKQKGDKGIDEIVTKDMSGTPEKIKNFLRWWGKDNGKAMWSGEKTRNFFQNLRVEINPAAASQGSTNDLWVARALGYTDDTIPGDTPRYVFANKVMQKLADATGLRPHQAQAAMWTAMQSRWEQSEKAADERSVALGYATRGEKNKIKILDESNDNRIRREEALALKDPKIELYDYSTALGEFYTQLSWESSPGGSWGFFENYYEQSPEDQKVFLDEVYDALHDGNGYFIPFKHLGIPFLGSKKAPGVWGTSVSPGVQTSFAVSWVKSKEQIGSWSKAEQDNMRTVASVLGILLGQDAMGINKPVSDDRMSTHNGVRMRIKGREGSLTEAEALTLSDLVQRNVSSYGYDLNNGHVLFISDSVDGMLIVNNINQLKKDKITPIDNKEFLKIIGQVLDEFEYVESGNSIADVLAYYENERNRPKGKSKKALEWVNPVNLVDATIKVEYDDYRHESVLMKADSTLEKDEDRNDGYISWLSQAERSSVYESIYNDVSERLQEIRNKYSAKGWGEAGHILTPAEVRAEGAVLQSREKILNQTQPAFDQEYSEVESQYRNTDKWLKAPNGKDTNLTERQWVQVRTPAFKEWFGDWENDPENASKIVDENGEPLVVHHGTMQRFDVFSRTSDIGFHFGNEDQAAEAKYNHYTREAPWFGTAPVEDDVPIMDVFLNIRNPVTGINDAGQWTGDNVTFYHELLDKGYISAYRAKGLDRMWELDDLYNRTGDASRLTQYLKDALAENGYDGIIYTNMFEGVTYDGSEQINAESYMAFNADQIKSATENSGAFSSGNPSIFYQTEEEDENLMSDARDMSREDFVEYGSFMYEDYSEAQLHEIWNKAHGKSASGRQEGPAITEDMTDDQKDEEFIRYFESDDALRSLINKLRSAYSLRKESNQRGIGAASEEEYDAMVRDLEIFDRFMREASPFFKNIISGTGEVSDTSLKNIRTTMENAPRMYRDLYAEITGDDSLRADVYDEYLPGIDEPGYEELRGMSIADRKRLSEQIENKALKEKILSGTETLDGDAEKVIRSMDEEIAKLEEDLRQMQAKNNEYYNSLNKEEKEVARLNEELEDAMRQLDDYNRKIRLKLDKSKRVSPKVITERNTIQEKIDLLNDQIKKLRATDRTKARRKAIANLKEEIREKQAARREAKKVHDYKLKLASAITREVSNAVDYEYRQRILAIQALVDPNFRQNTIWYEGKRYTVPEFRDYFRSMFKGVSDEELNEEIRKDYEAFGLTRKQAERLVQKNLNDFTVAELEEMAQQVADLRDEGRQVWQAKQDEKRRQARRLQNQIMAGIMSRPHAKTPDEMPTPGTAEDKKAQKNVRKQIRTAWFKTLNMDRKAQMLDNDEKGVAYDLLIRRRRDVQATESKAKSARIDPVMKLMRELNINPQDLYETVDITMNGKTEKFTYSDLYYGLAAQRDERNYRAFAYGTLVTIGEKDQLGNDNDLIQALGDAKDRQFVQQAEAALAQKPEFVKLFKTMEDDLQSHSAAMAEFSIREYNDVPAFQDYYLPIYRADFNGTKLAAQLAEDTKRQNPGKNASLPSMSRWKERIDISANNQRPVHMDYFSTWLETVEEVEHTIATLGYERDLKRVFQNFGSETLKSYIDANFGRGMLKDIDNYINEVGNPPVYNDVQGTEKTIRSLRGNLYSAYLGFKASGIVLQAITSPAPTLGFVNPFSLARNLLRMTFEYRKTWDFVSGMSEFMKNRSMDPALDIVKREANTYTDPKLKRAYARFLEKGTMGLEVIDRWAVTASWMSLYEKKLNEFEFQTDPESMRQAARYADEIIAETQPTADPAELAPLFKSRSEWAKAFMQFTTSMNVIWNNVTYDIIAQARKKGTFKRNVGMLFGYALAGAILGAVQNGTGDEDEPEDNVRHFIYNMTTQFTGSVPVFGTAIDQLVEGVITGKASQFYGSNSIFPGIEDTLKGLTKLGESFSEEDEAKRKQKLETALRNMTKGVGLLAGVPTSALSDLKRTFLDEDGFTFNPAALAGRRD